MSPTERDRVPTIFDYPSQELDSIPSPLHPQSSLQLWNSSYALASSLILFLCLYLCWGSKSLPFSHFLFLHPALYLKAFGIAPWGKGACYPDLQPEFHPWDPQDERRNLTSRQVPEHTCCCTCKWIHQWNIFERENERLVSKDCSVGRGKEQNMHLSGSSASWK